MRTDEVRDALSYFGAISPLLRTQLLPPTAGGSALLERLTNGRVREIRLLFDLGIALPLVGAIRRGRFDLVYARRWLPVAIASRLDVSAVYDTHSAREAAPLLRCAERGRLAGVIAHSHLAARELIAAGVSADVVRVCYNGYSPQDLEPRLTREAARDVLGLPHGVPVVVYTGRVKRAKAPAAILEVAARTPGVQYVLVGWTSPTEARALTSVCAAARLDNVRVDPWCPPTQLAPYLHAADILIVPPSAAPLGSRRTILPLKTFLYLAAGRAIVAPALEDLCEVLEHNRNAVLVPPDDAVACAAAITSLLGDPERMRALGRQAAAAAAAYTWDRRATAVAAFLTERCQCLPSRH